MTITGWWFGTAVTAQRLSRSAADRSRALGGSCPLGFQPCPETSPWTSVVFRTVSN